MPGNALFRNGMSPASLAVIESAVRASALAGATIITPDNVEIRAICAHRRPIVGAVVKSAIMAAGKKAATTDAMFVSLHAKEATPFDCVTIACAETGSVFGANHEATIRAAEALVEYTDARASFVLDQIMCAIAAVDGVHHKNMHALVSAVAELARAGSIVHAAFTCADLALFGVEIDLACTAYDAHGTPTFPHPFATCEARVSVTNPHVLFAKLRASGIGDATIAEWLASYAITTEAATRRMHASGNARTLVDVRWLAMGTADSDAEMFSSPDKARVVADAPMPGLKRAASVPEQRHAKRSCRANLGL